MFHIFVKESYTHVYEEIVQWVIEHWSHRNGALYTQLIEKQTAQMRTLEGNGFVSKGVSEVTRAYNLAEMETGRPILADGFQLVDMATHYDPIGLAKLKANSFNDRDSVPNVELLAHEYVRTSPIYSVMNCYLYPADKKRIGIGYPL